GQYIIAGFIDDVSPHRAGEPFCGSTILGDRVALSGALNRGVRNMIVAIGDCQKRLELSRVSQSYGFRLPNAVHSSATVASDSKFGNGNVIAAGAIVNPGCLIDDCVIINTAASVDHDCKLHSAVHLSPGTHLAGRVVIGEGTWI